MTHPSLPRRDVLRLGAASLALPLLAGASPPLPAVLQKVRDQAVSFVDAGDAPSLSVAVFHHGRPIWVEAFGWADRSQRRRATPATRYVIASASKPFTATLIAQLVAAGRLDLDRPIGDYLGGLAIGGEDPAARVSLRQVAQHRSGIPRHWRNFFRGQEPPPGFSMVAREHLFTTAAQSRRYLYSNLNYALLAAVIEAQTGKPFHRHLGDMLFKSLGLTSASTLADHFGSWRAAIPYEADGTPIPPFLVDETGARDLVMTAADLARFGVAHLDGRFGPATAAMLAHRELIEADGAARSSYGLGWMIEEDTPAAMFTYGHSGEGPGAASSLTIVPAEQLVVATVANAQGPPAYRLNEAIVDAISPDYAARREAHPYQDPLPVALDLAPFTGNWAGQVTTATGSHPVHLAMRGADASQLRFGDGEASALTRLAIAQDVLSARSDQPIPAADAQRWPHQTRIHLERQGATLAGTIAAYASKGVIAHDQYWLSYPLRLAPLAE